MPLERWIYTLPLKLRSLFRRAQTNRDLDDELRDHLALKIEQYISQGMSPAEARRHALIDLGGIEPTKERCRDTRRVNWIQDFAQDVRFVLRLLRKSPGFTAVAILTLALGIGASTVGFSVFYNLLFNAFAAKDASRLAVPMLQTKDSSAPSGESLDIFPCSLADFEVLRAAFEDIACSGHALTLVNDGKETWQLQGAYVTANAFEFYGVPALVGRGILPSDGKPEAPAVFVMSYKTWTDEFGLNPEILGKSFTVNGEARTLVGIMPPRFQAYGALTNIWTPINAGDAATPTINLYILARLRRGEALDAASAEMNVVATRMAKANPNDFPNYFAVRVQSAADFLMGPWGIGSAGGSKFGLKDMVFALLAGGMILLLIACVNVANLLLARATVRGQEIAVRAALGATRWRLVRQLLAESLLLAAAACAAGCALAYFGLKGVSAILPQKGIAVGGESEMSLNSMVLLFALSATVLTTLICGLAPAIHAVGRDLRTRLTGSGVGGGTRHGRLRSALVIGEVALSIVLLIGAGLLVRSFFVLTHVNMGFDPTHLIFAAFGQASWEHENTNNNGSRTFRDEAFQQLKLLPGVVDAAVNNSLLGYNSGRHSEVIVPGATRSREAGFDGCSENLVTMLGLRLLRGRWLTANDVASAQHVAVLNETMARDFFGDGDPVGRRIEANAFGEPPHAAADRYFQVIGVVKDTKDYDGPEQSVRPMAYIPYTIEGYALFLVKTKAPPAHMVHAIQQSIWAVDPNVFQDLEPVQDILYRLTYSGPEFVASAIAPLAVIALLLVLAGLFSVMAYAVSLQTHEIGIRMALGAQQGNILRMILSRGLGLVATGVIIGVFASLELTRFIASQIWGISATDPATFITVAILLVIVAVAASWIPARRATKVDPVVALRYE
jgi:predicted permease